MTKLTLHPIPAFSDNYLWALHNDEFAVVVDPGSATEVVDYLSEHKLQLAAVLVTHHHPDHIGGLQDVCNAFPDATVYGPVSTQHAAITDRVRDGQHILIPELEVALEVFEVPGHTLDHVAYYGADLLFCGDTLFSAGCGRLFEGTPAQMQKSLARLANLPAHTKVCCAHEYTLANLKFAQHVEPSNTEIVNYVKRSMELRSSNNPTLPSNIGQELLINPFLRVSQPSVRHALMTRSDQNIASDAEAFAILRRWKDNF